MRAGLLYYCTALSGAAVGMIEGGSFGERRYFVPYFVLRVLYVRTARRIRTPTVEAGRGILSGAGANAESQPTALGVAG